jgi:deoxycytidylate deaminase
MESRYHTEIDRACACANRSECTEFKLGSVILMNGRVVASGWNSREEHAEMCSVRHLRNDLNLRQSSKEA